MKSIYQMELEDKFNRKIKYREKKLKNQRMIIGKQQEVIERLNKENKILRENAEHNDKVVDKVNWENKRLNNIINKLEKWLKEKDYNGFEKFYIEDALYKIEELKGSDK